MSELQTHECWVYDYGCRAEMVSKPEAEAVLAAQDKAICHHKFKRCVAMAKWCKYWANYWKCCEPPDCSLFIAKAKYYRKWQKRWLKIAKQFNSMAQ